MSLSYCQEVFKLTIENQLKYSQICPITFQASLIWSTIQDQDNCKKDDEIIIQQYQELIDDVNKKTCDLLIYAVDVFMKAVHIQWKVKHHSIITFVDQKVKLQLQKTKETFPLFIQNRFEYYEEQILKLTNKLVEGLFETLEDCVMTLVNQHLSGPRLLKSLNKILDYQLKRVGYDLVDFSYVQTSSSKSLFQHLKKTIYDVLYEFYSFLYKMSYFGNREMDSLNEVMHKYTFLANVDTYKMMQVEISQLIYSHICVLLDEQTFYRPEFYQYQSEIIHHALKHFYHLAEWVNVHFDNPQAPSTFIELIKSIDADAETLPQLNIQIIKPPAEKIVFNQDQDHMKNNLLYPDTSLIIQGLNIFLNFDKLFVEKSQDIKNMKSNQIGLVIQYQTPFDQYGPFLIGTIQNQLVIREVTNDNQWGAISSIESFEDLPFSQFIAIQTINLQKIGLLSNEAQRLKHDTSLNNQNHEGISFLTQQMVSKRQIKQVLTITYDEYLTNPEIHHQHLQIPKKPIRYGATTEYVAGKTLGTGLGYLIVNCLDDDMPWEDKLEDAGYTTVTWGLISLLSSRLPIVGLIIQQALLAYAVTMTVTNKVVNYEEKAKSLGHLAVQIGLGVVCIVGGHLLIPFHFWGAFMGGLSAGICIGLYSKLVIPKSLASLQVMIEQMDRRITPQGCLYYSPIVVDIMKIKEQFFLSTKPQSIYYISFKIKALSKSDWLTLSMVCLVNEVHYMFQLLLTKQIEKITKQREKKQDDQQFQVEFEDLKIEWIKNDVRMHDWKDCRKYILKQKLSIFEHHHSLQEFIEGMIENFKIP